MSKLILGIDEAGKGPVIGPLIVAGCLIRKEDEDELKKIGVKDSKDITSKRRESLANKIKDSALNYKTIAISPNEIDKNNSNGGNLNQLETSKIAKVINELNEGKEKIQVQIDCPSVNITKWKEQLIVQIENLSNLEFVCEHKADRNYVAVSAASILAKTKREEEVSKLKEKYGELMGSGYPSDHNTVTFVKNFGEKFQNDGIFRKSWDTWKRIHGDKEQAKLEF